MPWSVSIHSVGFMWILFVWILRWTSAESHICPIRKSKTLEDVKACSKFPTMVLNGYYLNTEKSFPGKPVDFINRELRKSYSSQKKCFFYKKVETEIEGCCSGWQDGQEKCDTPDCADGCKNGGRCIGPSKCKCQSRYTGIACEDLVTQAISNKRYCYRRKTCHDAKHVNDGHVMTYHECCQQPGAYSWGVGSVDCMLCNKTHISTDTMMPAQDSDTRTCINFGKYYYRTFDGLQFSFGGRCTYTMAMTNTWQIEMRVVNCHSFKTCRKRVTIVINNEKIIMEKGLVSIGSKKYSFLHDEAMSTPGRSCNLWRRGDFIFCKCHAGVAIKVDFSSTVYITLDKDRITEPVQGVCGNFNGNPGDDIKTRNGIPSHNPVYAADTWAISNEAEPCKGAGVTRRFCASTGDTQLAEQVCHDMLSGVFSECHKIISPYFLYKLCMNDVCREKQNRETIRCEYLNRFARTCAEADVIVYWRSQYLCPKTCEDGKVYRDCASKCPRTCKTLHMVMSDSCMECCPGCVCPEGQVTQNGKCVEPEECECHFNRMSYKTGEKIKYGCNSCKCSMGRWSCTEDKCLEMCEIIGLNHVRTFDNYAYSFNPATNCEFKVVTPRSKEMTKIDPRSDLHIAIKETKCPTMKDGYYCISAVIIRYQSETIMLEGRRVHISKNGGNFRDLTEIVELLPHNTKHFYIKAASGQYRMVRGFGFKILYDKRRALYIYLAPYYVNKVIGLCGLYNYNQGDDFMTYVGVPEPNSHTFVGMFKDVGCALKDVITENTLYQMTEYHSAKHSCRYLDPLTTHLFGECMLHTSLDIYYYHSHCIADNALRKSPSEIEPVCNMIAAAARHCALAGYDVQWSKIAALSKCPAIQCTKYGEIYQECGKTCTGNCRDFELNDQRCEEGCIPGCQCAPGTYLDDRGLCVKQEQCTCYDVYSIDNKVRDAGTKITRQCKSCTCTNGAWDCDNESCEDVECPENQEYVEKACLKRCETYDLKDTCEEERLYSGCGCQNNLVLSLSGKCIKPHECPCKHGKNLYNPGQNITMNCAIWQCRNRKFQEIEKINCPGVCAAYGLSHFSTFDDKMYDFEGSCTYILTKSGNDFKVEITNIPCGPTGVTCTKFVQITIKGIQIHLIKGKQIKIGGASISKSYRSEGLEVFSHSYWTIVAADKLGVVVKWDGGTTVSVSLAAHWMKKVTGLCGNYDGESENGEFFTSDDIEANSVDEFALSWQTDITCDDRRNTSVLITSPCSGSREGRYYWAEEACSIINGDVFQDCRETMDENVVSKLYKDCLIDACRCDKGGDCECLCTIVARFGAECNRIGKPVLWRTPKFCPMMCPYGKEYKACGARCKQTCENIGDEPEPYCQTANCFEGCFCPDGMIEDGDKCTPARECPCKHKNVKYKRGAIITENCMKCTCINGKFECVGEICKPECRDNEFICKNGDCIDKKYQCDLRTDCIDNSDEANCSYTCSVDEFSCDKGRCFKRSFLCDGVNDCLDGTDEMGCLPKCAENEFRCESGKCIPMIHKCDHDIDCFDKSDEAGCNGTVCQPYRTFKCIGPHGSEICLPVNEKCDGNIDCGDSSDEKNCKCTCRSSFTCADCKCKNKAVQCDGVIDCDDGSDEWHCPCSAHQYTCSDGSCTNRTTVCQHPCANGDKPSDCDLITYGVSTTLSTTPFIISTPITVIMLTEETSSAAGTTQSKTTSEGKSACKPNVTILLNQMLRSLRV